MAKIKKRRVKTMSKELSIGTIKKELMDAIVNNVSIIESFGKHENIKKITEYINRNIFSHINTYNTCTDADSYINLDVAYERGKYRVIIIVRSHKSLGNRADTICDAITDIIYELYPYYTSFINIPIRKNDNFIERQIYFLVSQDDADKYVSH